MGNVRSITEEEKEERRRMIMEAAKNRFQRFGYSKTTMEEVAGDAGISKGTIYLYFQNKEDVFYALLGQEALDMERFLYRRVKDEPSVVKQLEMIFTGALEYLEVHPYLDSILRRDVDMVSPRILKYIFTVEDHYVSVIEDYVRRGIEEGEIEPGNPRIIAYVLYKIFEAFSYASILQERDFNKKDIESFIPRLIRRALVKESPVRKAPVLKSKEKGA
jgi:AcrR family transcriptional regulator